MTAPETIYLQHDPENVSGEEFPSEDFWEHVTWASRAVFESDVSYTRTDLTIRRDDPVLKQVMEALDAISGAVPRFDYCECGPGGVDLSKPGSPYDRGKDDAFKLLQPIAKAALAAMQELIGGEDG